MRPDVGRPEPLHAKVVEEAACLPCDHFARDGLLRRARLVRVVAGPDGLLPVLGPQLHVAEHHGEPVAAMVAEPQALGDVLKVAHVHLCRPALLGADGLGRIQQPLRRDAVRGHLLHGHPALVLGAGDLQAVLRRLQMPPQQKERLLHVEVLLVQEELAVVGPVRRPLHVLLQAAVVHGVLELGAFAAAAPPPASPAVVPATLAVAIVAACAAPSARVVDDAHQALRGGAVARGDLPLVLALALLGQHGVGQQDGPKVLADPLVHLLAGGLVADGGQHDMAAEALRLRGRVSRNVRL
mmetsp:Transcript_22139/g.70720  ORF Transcript_22139/g.70720 Transcript_22139/m.70720 type:complete len:297 (-) Transcript_22139:217-1107(-)